MWSLVRLILAPRTLLWTVIAMALTSTVAWRNPEAFVAIGGTTGETQGRILGIFEIAPITATFTLAIGLAPRLMSWERFGAAKMGRLAAGVAAIIVAVPVGFFFAILKLYPADGQPPARQLWPIAGNVVVAGLLIVILIGTLGRLIGPLLWMLAMYLAYYVPARWPAVEATFPLNVATRADGSFDMSTRWAWLVALAVVAVAVVRKRRLVPIDFAMRPAEET